MDATVFSPSEASADIIPLFDDLIESRGEAISVALIGTYAPRRCGIATFTKDLADQLSGRPGFDMRIYALDSACSEHRYEGIAAIIAQDDREDYTRIARHINEAAVDAVWLQHEFGIFGGPDGEMVCDFVDRIAAPLIVTFHTVLTAPSPRQRAIVEHLISRASRIMVMSQQGRDTLVADYHAPERIVAVIPHGAPDRPFGREESFKAKLGLGDRPVVMTFGLLGPGKGLETMIEALPAIAARHPDILYRIVGATHPNLIAEQGERYRESLQALARTLGVERHVSWENRFLDTAELLDQLEACDIYVTPYGNLQQATSGTLSYAVALGKAVVSTPYVHATELLAGDVGLLVEPRSSEALAEAVNRLLDDPALLAITKRRAYEAGRRTIWPRFSAASAALVRQALRPRHRLLPLTATPGLGAVFTMSDGCGMLQHSIGIVPDRNHGYCLDDNARALMLMNLAGHMPATERLRWSLTYAGFVQHCWNPDRRRFRNFMHFDRRWCEEVGSEDSNGRALWALGHTIEHGCDPDMRRWAQMWFDQTACLFAEMGSPRAIAFAMLGAAATVRRLPDHKQARTILDQGGRTLFRLLAHARRPDWAWFEAVLGYDNPRLPQALIEAGKLLGQARWLTAGIDTLEWIAERQTAPEGHFRPVGSEGFGREHDQLPFDQQPLEAQAAIEAAAAAHAATADPRWIEHAEMAYHWYFGANDRGVILADIASGRCRDGVTPRGANENSGAESILAFQLAHHALARMIGAAHTEAETGDDAEAGARDTDHPATLA
jgi:glycosyltransferase involved in cell wall biosynthesis